MRDARFRLLTPAAALAAIGVLLMPALAIAQNVASDDGIVTFSRDVAPILQANCQVCHRPNSIAASTRGP